ncbi:hypothetical protein HYDPIDRAFT_31261, partial [Hydnomerulius pinastri MD-312]
NSSSPRPDRPNLTVNLDALPANDHPPEDDDDERTPTPTPTRHVRVERGQSEDAENGITEEPRQPVLVSSPSLSPSPSSQAQASSPASSLQASIPPPQTPASSPQAPASSSPTSTRRPTSRGPRQLTAHWSNNLASGSPPVPPQHPRTRRSNDTARSASASSTSLNVPQDRRPSPTSSTPAHWTRALMASAPVPPQHPRAAPPSAVPPPRAPSPPYELPPHTPVDLTIDVPDDYRYNLMWGPLPEPPLGSPFPSSIDLVADEGGHATSAGDGVSGSTSNSLLDRPAVQGALDGADNARTSADADERSMRGEDVAASSNPFLDRSAVIETPRSSVVSLDMGVFHGPGDDTPTATAAAIAQADANAEDTQPTAPSHRTFNFHMPHIPHMPHMPHILRFRRREEHAHAPEAPTPTTPRRSTAVAFGYAPNWLRQAVAPPDRANAAREPTHEELGYTIVDIGSEEGSEQVGDGGSVACSSEYGNLGCRCLRCL